MMNNTTWPIPTNISIFSTLSTGASTKESNSIFVASHVIIVVLAPVAVAGNVVVLTAIWKRSFQRTSFHILLSVLAFTDLLTGVASPLMSIPYLLNHKFGVVSRPGILISTYLLCLTILVITLLSVERWLHMTHRSLLTSRRGYLTAVISLLVPVPLVTLQALSLITKKMKLETNAAMGAYGLSCYLATSVAYFKVFRIIRQRQQQIHTNQSRQNFGQPAINLAKYKKSIFSVLCILALFSLCILPFIVSLFLLVLLGKKEGSWGPKHVSLVILFSASCLNPGLYIWRMKDVRDGVKKLCCCTNGSH
ncbi:histamine H2 receptor-like [Porites lutea]|uniref:histamine H2 receptor-like n=1 Tax=Porites lutea TaxID=51062 RepID=UPI003CC6B198